MNLIPDDLRAQLVANGRRSVENDRFDPPAACGETVHARRRRDLAADGD